MKITKPTLLLDKSKCLNNIKIMAEKATKNNLLLRPHFKTHQSIEIGKWFSDFGINSITVASVSMAEYFAQHGWKDITIAFPFNKLEIDEINELASSIELNLLILSVESINFLKKNLKHKVGIFIKIDAGYHRTGILPENIDILDEILTGILNFDLIEFKGFLTHSGHTYTAGSIDKITAIHNDCLHKMQKLKLHYFKTFPNLIVSIGDTPSCSLMDNFDGIDEIRPGNFVFYDLMQNQFGSCAIDQIALCVACPIVAKYKERNKIIVYGGVVHFSKEYILNEEGERLFGLIIELGNKGWSSPLEGMYVSSLSQEHGIIKAPDEHFEKFKVGDVIGILPVHACLTANLMGSYLTFANEVIDHMP
ncbi:MAG: alanine racemase [Candidatus Cloacimonetes bacterium]|nr:alanine racemase [Candidatus Cloacimonadota bacterium]